MQQGLSSISQKSAKTRKAPVQPDRRLRRYALFGGLFVIGVLGLAWMDGGEEPLHPIVQPVERAGAGS